MNASFNVYNACAGSGKTFTLVKEYLKILISSSSKDTFKYILAITFTNKAVNEMKERILERLHDFSKTEILEKNDPLLITLSQETGYSALEIHEKAKVILKEILHNYSFFDISTIDKFNHRLIRTFATDLKLPLNFEVALDTEILLQEAIDKVLEKTGIEKDLTKALVGFAREKAEQDKSWDIAKDLQSIAKILLTETDHPYFERLQDKNLADFSILKKGLKEQIETLETQIKEIGLDFLSLLEQNQLTPEDFSRKSLPNFMQKIANGDFHVKFDDSDWKREIETKTLYPKKVSNTTAQTIDMLQAQIAESFRYIEQGVLQMAFLKNAYQNSVPLSILNSIYHALKQIQQEKNTVLISEFNTIISQTIKNQPAPFIYERLGEKYQHFFIDEFQDTSQMQWQNLIPLADNALSANKGSLMLVGDAKQAIYRWRGGKAEQFIALFKEHNPFSIQKQVVNLPKNYRSTDVVVTFNNDFFTKIAVFLSQQNYQELFSKYAVQQTNGKDFGGVSISFIDPEDNAEQEALYAEKTLEKIQQALQLGYTYKDICILSQKKKHGVAIANYLTQKEIPIISSETLLLKNAPKINFITHFIQAILHPKDKRNYVHMLHYLAEKEKLTDKHAYFTKWLQTDIHAFLKSYNTHIGDFLESALYDMVEKIIAVFCLQSTSDAYLHYYLDIVLEFSEKQQGDFNQFLNYWHTKKDSFSIIAPQGVDAVQIMTIHKSKGLEFPVVIYPYADADLHQEIDPKIWFATQKDDFYGFSELYLSKNKSICVSPLGETLYNQDRAKLELDKYNVLYVALTRAVDKLYIISRKNVDAKGVEKTHLFSGLFIYYLKAIGKWDPSILEYTFGDFTTIQQKKQEQQKQNKTISFIASSKKQEKFKIVTKAGILWDTHQQKAIERGNLIHQLLSQIYQLTDVAKCMDMAVHKGSITLKQKEILTPVLLEILKHPMLAMYYTDAYTSYNEREIFSQQADLLIPDKIAINNQNQEVVVIDYKTGSPSLAYQQQLHTYQQVLEQIGLNVTKKILVYINETITVEHI